MPGQCHKPNGENDCKFTDLLSVNIGISNLERAQFVTQEKKLLRRQLNSIAFKSTHKHYKMNEWAVESHRKMRAK